MADIGARLREARMRAKIDINEVEMRTKIRAKYLRAIENEEWDLLPGEVYVKSFLRTYGEYLGLDTRQLTDDFKHRYERPSDSELRPITPPGRDRERRARRRRLPPWAPIALVLVIVAAALWFVGRGGPKSTSTPTSARVTTGHKVRHARHRARHGAASRRQTGSRSVKLQLVPTGQIYVCLVNGSGKRLISGLIFNRGQAIATETGSKLLLTLGNNQVRMKVNGAVVRVPALTGSIGYELLPGTQTMLPVSRQPRCA